MEQLNSGESKIIFRLISCIVIIGLMETRKDFSVVLILQEQILYLRGLQGHSGRSLID